MLRLIVIVAMLLPAPVVHAKPGLFARLFRVQKAPTKKIFREQPSRAPSSESLTALVKIPQLSGAARIEKIAPHTFSGGFHGTRKAPEEVLRVGLRARGHDRRLDHHANPGHYHHASAFRGTTAFVLSPDGKAGAALWPGAGGYVYEIRNVPTWDVNAALEGSRLLPGGIHAGNLAFGEQEFAIPGAVSPKHIKRWAKVEKGKAGHLTVGTWHDNPAFEALE